MATDIVVDCDPGHDDAIALFLAAGSEAVDLRAVTTVAGNHTVENTTRNARRLLTLLDRPDVPIGRGMAQPLVRDFELTEAIHGETGIDGADLPEPAVSLDGRHGVDLLIDTVRSNDGVTLVPVGPLTNVAAALRKAPDIAAGIDEVVVMGGAIGAGNVTPAAEFNVHVDPEAARIVFESDLDVTMIGLDVTHEALITPEEVERFRDLGNVVGPVAADLIDFAAGSYETVYGMEGYPVHDAVAVARVVDGGLVETERMRVDVETRGEFTAGRTVCDTKGVIEARPPNVAVGTGLDRDGFMDTLTDALGAL